MEADGAAAADWEVEAEEEEEMEGALDELTDGLRVTEAAAAGGVKVGGAAAS